MSDSIADLIAAWIAESRRDEVPPLAAAQARVGRLLADRGSPRYR